MARRDLHKLPNPASVEAQTVVSGSGGGSAVMGVVYRPFRGAVYPMSSPVRTSPTDRERPHGAAKQQQEEPTMNSMARRMFELVEPIGVIPYSADEPNEAMFALGFTNYWDTYFAGRAAPLGLVPAEVVDALFYNFAPGEVARHIPKVWRTTTPEAAIAARQMGCVKALRRILGDHVGSAAFARAANCWKRRPPAHRTRAGPCTPRCGPSRSPKTLWPVCSMPLQCCASTVATGTSPP